MILLETSVLIQHLRRRQGEQPMHAYTLELQALANQRAIVGIPAMTLQEVLAGAQTDEHFQRMEHRLRLLAQVVSTTEEDHVLAARISSHCRRKGVTTGAPDALIAAQAILRGAKLFAEDCDYADIQRVLPILRRHHVGDAPEEVEVDW